MSATADLRRRLLPRLAVTVVCGAGLAPSLCCAADWDPKKAVAYLDARQEVWFGWKPAAAKGGPCVSCHTGVTYSLARPALRKALGESIRTSYESGLLDGVTARLDKPKPAESDEHAMQAFGVESVLSTLLLSLDNPSSQRTLKAFDRMWEQQIRSGESRGAWHWFNLDLDPWETTQSTYYGASLAALAVGNMDDAYRKRHEVRERISDLKAYLQSTSPGQPLHNRLILLWASARFGDILQKSERKQVIETVWLAQQSDGGWTLESLGPWKQRPAVAVPGGSHAYATAWAAFTLRQAGVSPSDKRMSKALAWLASHQDPEGFWEAKSMNKVRDPASVPFQFMRDAATAYAAMALLGPPRQ